MKTSFRETKLFFEKMFLDNWNETPIHFVGQEFKNDGIDRWINPFYTPVKGAFRGLSGTLSESKGRLEVICWAENDAEVMQLADELVELVFSHTSNKTYRIDRYEVTDHAWHTSNSVYMYLTFEVTMVEGYCRTDILRYVVNKGVTITNRSGQYTVINS